MTTLIQAKQLLRRFVPDGLVHTLRSFAKADAHTERFIAHNRRVWRNWDQPNADSVILFDDFSVPQTVIAYSYFLNVLARRYNGRLASFSSRRFLSPVTARVFSSFNARDHICLALTSEQAARRDTVFQELLPRMQTKQDLFDLTVLGAWIGIDVYESYLRDFSEPTVSLSDPRLWSLLKRAIGVLVFWMDYVRANKVAAVVVSHDVYVEYDILCKVAYAHGIPAYLPNARGISFADSPHATYAHMRKYKEVFDSLAPEQQQRGIDWAKHQLERRLSGEIGVDMPYSTKSAFRQSSVKRSVLRKSDRIKVLIATHCFYDNPHGYGGMLFLDFLEWLHFLGKVSERSDYDWYIKVHPDPLPGTLKIVDQFTRGFPRITPVPPEVSHPQLIEEGIQFVLTCYGTVGFEYPLLGVPVITAAYNPTSSFDFNWHPKTVAEYEDCLLNLAKLRKPIDAESLYACYYMHYDYWFADDLIFRSHREFTGTHSWEEQVSSIAYEQFLDGCSEERHREIIRRMDGFISADKAEVSQKTYSQNHVGSCVELTKRSFSR